MLVYFLVNPFTILRFTAVCILPVVFVLMFIHSVKIIFAFVIHIYYLFMTYTMASLMLRLHLNAADAIRHD